MKTLGLYLHIPFCRSKCLYCDFCSLPHREESVMKAYVEKLCADLIASAPACRDYEVDSVYLGGGTPTALPTDQITRILHTVYANYNVTKDAEVSAECNPRTADGEKFTAMREAGCNRLSIGLQSANEPELKLLGRTHRFEDFQATFQAAERAGFSRISADVMFGIPSQTERSFHETLEAVCSLHPEHLSAYSLILEEGTPLFERQARYVFPSEEETRTMYFDLIDTLSKNGLFQYEISNFARPGCESRHNLKYWNSESYLGFGPAAYSDFEGVRFGNGRDVDAYLRGEDVTAERSAPSATERENEYVMLKMRLNRGVSRKEFQARFGKNFEELFGKSLQPYLQSRHVTETKEGYAFTTEGFLVSNSILSDILSFGQ